MTEMRKLEGLTRWLGALEAVAVHVRSWEVFAEFPNTNFAQTSAAATWIGSMLVEVLGVSDRVHEKVLSRQRG